MAISLNGSSQYATLGSALLTATPITISGWGYAATGAVKTYTMIGIFDTATLNELHAQIWRDGASDALSSWTKAGGTNGLATTGNAYTGDTWGHGFSRFVSATSRIIRFDAGATGTDPTNLTPSGLDQTAIGAAVQSSVSQYFDGDIAEVAVWSRNMTQDIYLALFEGASPLFFPEGLEAYWPLIDDWSDWSGNGHTMTPVGSPSFVDNHPDIFYPSGTTTVYIAKPSAITVNTTPVNATWAVPATATNVTQNTSPVSATWAVPAVTLAITQNTTPVNATWAVPAPATALSVTTTPVSATWAVPTPTVSIGTLVTTTPVNATWAVPTPSVSLTANTSPVAASWSLPAPSPDVSLTTSPVAGAWAVPAPATTIQQSPSPITVNWGVPVPSLALTETTSPVNATWQVPTPTATIPTAVKPVTWTGRTLGRTWTGRALGRTWTGRKRE